MIGDYVMTENDLNGNRETPKSIGMGSYTMDSHNAQRYITSYGAIQNEGDIGVHIPPYEIALGSILPKQEECKNLIVTAAVSSSHIAFGSIRMEPVFMILGQSGAQLAHLALSGSKSIYDVSYEELKPALEGAGQVLELAPSEDTHH